MSTAPAGTETLSSTSSPRIPRGALVTVFALLVLGAGARFAFLLVHPPIDHLIYDYASISAIRETWWFSHFYLAGFGFPLAFAALAILVAALCASRGLVLALLGGIVATLGALLTGLGFAAEGVTWAYLTDPDVVSPMVGAEVLHALGDHPALIDDPILNGFLIIPLGVLLQLVALWRSRRVPRAILIAVLVVLVVSAIPLPLPHWSEGVKAGIELVALVTLGSFALRRL